MDLTSYLLGKKSGGGGGGENPYITSSASNTKGGFFGVIERLPELDMQGTSGMYMFAEYKGNVIPKLNNSSQLTTIQNIFYNCSNILELDLTYFDTSNITMSASAFYGCSKLKKLNLKGWDTTKITNMNSMFGNCRKLAVLDLSTFDFSSVTSQSNMFSSVGSESLQSDGAYADGIPYIYVKDATAKNWILTKSNGRPNTWTTSNVIIKRN